MEKYGLLNGKYLEETNPTLAMLRRRAGDGWPWAGLEAGSIGTEFSVEKQKPDELQKVLALFYKHEIN